MGVTLVRYATNGSCRDCQRTMHQKTVPKNGMGKVFLATGPGDQEEGNPQRRVTTR